MFLDRLTSSDALQVRQYTDIDEFRESERYVRAESMPLRAANPSVLRASFALPSSTLALVRTFPRIINGYEMPGRIVLVIPMDEVSSARINGEPIGHSILVLRGRADCTVYEPEGRLVAILSVDPAQFDAEPHGIRDGYSLVDIPAAERGRLQALIADMLEFAARASPAMQFPVIRDEFQSVLLLAVGDAMRAGQPREAERSRLLTRYRMIVDRIDEAIRYQPASDLSAPHLAEQIGVSVRTLQNATTLLCGTAPHRYSRLRRLWSVRNQLRSGAPGLTVKISADAHGFNHMGEFSRFYASMFGELPSETLISAR